jgi:hypothetical protein
MKNVVLAMCALFIVSACGDDEKESTVLVFKYKGSVQCDSQSGVPLDNMVSVLIDANISVLCSFEANNGSVVSTVCGADTGTINVYEIPVPNLIQAENLGFNNVQLLENANIVSEC